MAWLTGDPGSLGSNVAPPQAASVAEHRQDTATSFKDDRRFIAGPPSPQALVQSYTYTAIRTSDLVPGNRAALATRQQWRHK
jgi:hypothetical protein